jgi:hypothetical protein
MDYYATIFWLGFFILLLTHIQLLRTNMQQHALVALTGTAMMFVGSKLGREFLGIK